MKYSAIVTAVVVAALLPVGASAHESQVFDVDDLRYEFVIGSLNEPVMVDDKTGVDLRITEIGQPGQPLQASDHSHDTGSPVIRAEESLKVEIIAGNEKKTLDLSPVYNTPGAYKAIFYPTVATTYSYRVFGELNQIPFDVTFTCNPAGHASATEDTNRVEISDKVTRLSKSGSFGCPSPKAEHGFPEASAEIVSLRESGSADTTSWAALALAVAALAVAYTRKRS